MVIWALMAAACGNAPPPATGAPQRSRPPRPEHATAIPPHADLAATIARAPAGATLALAPGEYPGPVTIDRPLTLWGPPEAVVRSRGVGSTIDVTAPGVALLGFTVDGSGGRFDQTDAAVRVRADDVRVEGLLVRNALFGVLVEKAARVDVTGNVVVGNGNPSLGLRGDGIRLWEVTSSQVRGNLVEDSRDVVVWYSSDNVLRGNVVRRSRYGMHLMYSHDNLIENNRFLHNVVAVFLMYSRGVTLRGNELSFSAGAAGLGLGLKESSNLTVVGNRFVRDGVAIHSDNSPLGRDDHNRFERNLIQGCRTAVVFNGIAERSSFVRNVFRSNLSQVRVDGGEHARSVTWLENDFDDYRGYDLDGDGYGDVPYELRSFSTTLVGRYPEIAFLRGTPALAAVDLAGHVMPLFQPKTILVDPKPSMLGAKTLEVARAH